MISGLNKLHPVYVSSGVQVLMQKILTRLYNMIKYFSGKFHVCFLFDFHLILKWTETNSCRVERYSTSFGKLLVIILDISACFYRPPPRKLRFCPCLFVGLLVCQHRNYWTDLQEMWTADFWVLTNFWLQIWIKRQNPGISSHRL